jgi:cyclic pyranopterin phosphate synthase
MSDFTHIDDEGRVRMVDVSGKNATVREAIAEGIITMKPDTFARIRQQKIKKGNVLETARIAAVMAAKKTADIIPMCHPLKLTHVQVDFIPSTADNRIRIEATVRAVDQTGVEMEALTAVSVAALTIYDMCKAVDKEMTISSIGLRSKKGGKSGRFERQTQHNSP